MSVVIVTGASSGIGEAAAKHLARKRGATVVLVARRADRLERLASEIGAGASYVAVDVTEEGAPEQIRAQVLEQHGRVDVLVNNAGRAWRKTFDEGGSEDVKRTMDLNFFAPVRLCEALLPALRESRGAIVNITSVAGRVARPKTGSYSASKAALTLWSDALRAEQAEHGVHVGTVLPGFIKTEGFPARELIEKPATRWIVSEPEKVAAAIEAVAYDRVPERIVPRGYAVFGTLRALVPRVVFRSVKGGGLTTSTGSGDD